MRPAERAARANWVSQRGCDGYWGGCESRRLSRRGCETSRVSLGGCDHSWGARASRGLSGRMPPRTCWPNCAITTLAPAFPGPRADRAARAWAARRHDTVGRSPVPGHAPELPELMGPVSQASRLCRLNNLPDKNASVSHEGRDRGGQVQRVGRMKRPRRLVVCRPRHGDHLRPKETFGELFHRLIRWRNQTDPGTTRKPGKGPRGDRKRSENDDKRVPESSEKTDMGANVEKLKDKGGEQTMSV